MYSPNFALVICLVVFTAHSVQPFGGHRNTNEIKNNTNIRNNTDFEEPFFKTRPFFGTSFERLEREMDGVIDDMVQNVKDIRKEIKEMNLHVENSTKSGNTTIYIIKNNYCDPPSSCNQQGPVQNRKVNPPSINATNINDGSSDKQHSTQKQEINPSLINVADINNGSYSSDKRHKVQKREITVPWINPGNINDGSYSSNKQNSTPKKEVNRDDDYNDDDSSYIKSFYASNGDDIDNRPGWKILFQNLTHKNGPVNDDGENYDDYSFEFNINRKNHPEIFHKTETVDYIYDDNNRTEYNYIPSYYDAPDVDKFRG